MNVKVDDHKLKTIPSYFYCFAVILYVFFRQSYCLSDTATKLI